MLNTNVKRSKTFTNEEERFLWSLVKKYWSIVQCKKTDHENNQKKKSAWLQIEREFNSESEGGTYRNAATLKTKFENMNRNARKRHLEKKGAEEAKLKASLKPKTPITAIPSSSTSNQHQMNEEEQMDFLCCVSKVIGVGENAKDLDEGAWSTITLLFNAGKCEEDQFTVEELVNIYKILNKDVQKKDATRKKRIRGTGGGEYQDVHYTQIDEEIISQMGARAVGLRSDFDDDDDGGIDGIVIEEEEEDEVMVDEPATIHEIEMLRPPQGVATSGTTNWAKYNPAMLRGERSEKLRFPEKNNAGKKNASEDPVSKKRRVFNDKLSAWAAEKVNVADTQKKKHELSLKAEQDIMKVRLDREVTLTRLMTEEVKLRMKFMTEKHNAEIDLISIQRKKLLINADL